MAPSPSSIVPRRSRLCAPCVTLTSAATRINGMSYSKFICGLKKAGVDLNRKVLADLAVNDAAAFAKLVEVAKNA